MSVHIVTVGFCPQYDSTWEVATTCGHITGRPTHHETWDH